MDRGDRRLFKLVSHVLGESSDGAEMPGDAESEKVQRVSPRDCPVMMMMMMRTSPGRISLIYSPFVFRAIAIMAVGIISIVSLCCYTGVVIFAAFYDCDPVTTKVRGISVFSRD